MVLVFKYRRYANRYVPAAQGRLRNGVNELPLAAIIDSGSDFTTIPLPLAELLGINLTDTSAKVAICGATYTARLGHCDIVLEARGQRRVIQRVPVDVIEAPPDAPYPPVLLGRAGIFHHFAITFRERGYRTLFKPEAGT